MEKYKIKIYVASESDTIDSICQKHEINKNLLLIFNPMLKNKQSIKNLPIKIPYLEAKTANVRKEKEVEKTNYHCVFNLLKTYSMYQILIKEKNQFLYNMINNEIKTPLEKGFFNKIFELIDKYDILSSEEYMETIDYLINEAEKIGSDFMLYNQAFLHYINLMQSKKYDLAEQSFYSK